MDLDCVANQAKLGVWHLKVKYDAVRDILVYDRSLHKGSGSSLYGIEVAPVLVTGAYLEIPFIYDPITKCVMTSGFAFDLNENLTVNLVWN